MSMLIICEKPSVAKTIAAALGAREQKDGYIGGDGILVSWCVGHLVSMSDAGCYDERYKKWRYISLTATFAYDGSLCNVSSVSATASNVDDDYIVKKTTGTEQISPTYAKAQCYFELYKDGLFTDELRSACTVIIYCNQNGTITKEWNG